MIVAEHALADLPHRITPVAYGRTASGYGRRIPTSRMVQIPGSPRWRRVYCCCYSNAGTCYVTRGKDWIVIF